MEQDLRRMHPLRVVVAGGGIAGLETLVALRALAQERVTVTLVDPRETFAVRALAIGEPFGLGGVPEYELADLAAELGAGFIRDGVGRVHPDRRAVELRSGAEVSFDALVLAVGAAAVPAYRHGVAFDRVGQPEAFDDVLADVESEAARTIAIVVPQGVAWTLPAYELALMLAAHGAGRPPQLTVVTAERAPLEAFGAEASRMVREELDAAGVELLVGARPDVASPRRLAVGPKRVLEADRIIHLPRMIGPRVRGVPCDAAGFIPVDAHGLVEGESDVYAAGDGTARDHKQGGLAAQQADAVAAHLAWRAGAEIEPKPYAPVLRGLLRTRRGPRYMRAEPPGGGGDEAVSNRCLWWPPSKVASRWLIPWLATRDSAGRGADAVTEPASFAIEAQSGHRRESSFERVVGAGAGPGVQRAVAFDRRAAASWGWHLVERDTETGERRTTERLALARALELLPAGDRDAAVGVHRAALDAACAALSAIHAHRGAAADPERLGRLAFFARQIDALAGDLGDLRRPVPPPAVALSDAC